MTRYESIKADAAGLAYVADDAMTFLGPANPMLYLKALAAKASAAASGRANSSDSSGKKMDTSYAPEKHKRLERISDSTKICVGSL